MRSRNRRVALGPEGVAGRLDTNVGDGLHTV
jgi:hypothetical protein